MYLDVEVDDGVVGVVLCGGREALQHDAVRHVAELALHHDPLQALLGGLGEAGEARRGRVRQPLGEADPLGAMAVQRQPHAVRVGRCNTRPNSY